MKFRSREEERKVKERMVALFELIKIYLNEDTRECVEIALRIILDTGVESEEQDADRRCGTCKYFGAETGKETREMESYHRCNSRKSGVSSCIMSATACEKYINRRAESER